MVALAALVTMLAGACHAIDARAASVGPAGARQAASTEARVIVTYRDPEAQLAAGTARALSSAGAASGNAPRRASALGQRQGVALREGQPLNDRTQVLMASGLSSDALVQRLAADPAVASVRVDPRMRAHSAPNDPLYAASSAIRPPVGQWYLRAPQPAGPGQIVSPINIEAAWAITPGSANVVVAVLDTGVRPDHPDLAGKLLPGYDFISDAAQANDGDGRDSDPSDPGDWVTAAENSAPNGQFNGCADPNPSEDSSWHGTQTTALIAAATDNGIGMAGAGRLVRVLPVRVLGKCGGFASDIIDAMRWAAGLAVSGVPLNPNPARIINLSLGGPGACDPIYQGAIDELTAMGVVIVASAGNAGLAVDEPANCRGVIAVGGVRHIGTKGLLSSLGPEVAISAPMGSCTGASNRCEYPILSASNTGTTVPAASTYTDDTFATAGIGTSFSAPLVAATVALMRSVQPGSSVTLVRQWLRAGAAPFATVGAPGTSPALPACLAPTTSTAQSECLCTTSTCGAGMLDAGASVAAAKAYVAPPSSGGGGALDWGWLAGLAAAVAALAWLRRAPG